MAGAFRVPTIFDRSLCPRPTSPSFKRSGSVCPDFEQEQFDLRCCFLSLSAAPTLVQSMQWEKNNARIDVIKQCFHPIHCWVADPMTPRRNQTVRSWVGSHLPLSITIMSKREDGHMGKAVLGDRQGDTAEGHELAFMGPSMDGKGSAS